MGTLKHFSWFMAAPIALILYFSLLGKGSPLGNFWWDYLALKGLGLNLFSDSATPDELWLPFILPVYLLEWAEQLAGPGLDYLVAHSIIAIATLAFSYKPVFTKLPPRLATLTYIVIVLFSVVPVVLDPVTLKSYTDANAIAYLGFYNRYLDIIFCLLLVSFACLRGAPDKWTLAFWLYAMIVALLSKFSYFLVFTIMIAGVGVLRHYGSCLWACVTILIPCALLHYMAPTYFTTIITISEVRNVPISEFGLPFLAIGIVASIIAYRLKEKYRSALFLIMPPIGSLALSFGNNGELDKLRWVFIIGFSAFYFWSLIKSRSMTVIISKGTETEIRVNIDFIQISVFVITMMLAVPMAIVIKTATITAIAIAAHDLEINDDFITYKHFPGFFSHPHYINERGRIEYDQTCLESQGAFYRGEKKHTVAYFTLYLAEVERTLDFLEVYQEENIAWISFPGFVPQLANIGNIPQEARPWYLFSKEIDEEHHPNFKAIADTSQITVIDRCDWGNGPKLLEVFGDDIIDGEPVAFTSKCFRIYRKKLLASAQTPDNQHNERHIDQRGIGHDSERSPN